MFSVRIGHGIACVDRKVDQARHRLASDRPSPATAAWQSCPEIHIFASARCEQSEHVLKAPIEIDRFRLEMLHPREREQPADQLGAAPSRTDHVVGHFGGVGPILEPTGTNSELPWMIASRLLKSCATPPVSRRPRQFAATDVSAPRALYVRDGRG